MNNGRFTKQITAVELTLLNFFIVAYTALFHSSVSTRTQAIMDPAVMKSSVMAHVVTALTTLDHAVPLTPRPIVWVQPRMKDNTWVYWSSRTPMRWRSNKCSSPFVAVHTTLWSTEAQRLNASTERCRLNEFRTLKINPRRHHTTKDGGIERVYVDDMFGPNGFKHPICNNGCYNQPILKDYSERMLGISPNRHCAVRYEA